MNSELKELLKRLEELRKELADSFTPGNNTYAEGQDAGLRSAGDLLEEILVEYRD